MNGQTQQWNAGSWGAISLLNGKIIWQIPAYGPDLQTPQYGATAGGPMSFTNRVVLTGDSGGYMAALDANSGLTYWTYYVGGTIESAPAIYNDTLYWGAGYSHGSGVANPHLYAFRPSATAAVRK
jgi:hypothetical protein